MLDVGNYLASAHWGIITEVIFKILIYLNAVEYPYYNQFVLGRHINYFPLLQNFFVSNL